MSADNLNTDTPFGSDRPLLDEERIDLDGVAARDQDTDLYASDAWLDSVADQIDYISYTGGRGAFDPDAYDDEKEWLMDELCALLIRTHNETDLGLLEFTGAMRSVDEQIMNVADMGVEHYMNKHDIDAQRLDLEPTHDE